MASSFFQSQKSFGDTTGGDEVILPQCIDCLTVAPHTETAFTLIGPKFGWRLTFQDLDGERHQVWRCRGCWNRHRGRPVK